MNPPTYPGFTSTPLEFSRLSPLHLTEDPIFVSLFVDPVAEMNLFTPDSLWVGYSKQKHIAVLNIILIIPKKIVSPNFLLL